MALQAAASRCPAPRRLAPQALDKELLALAQDGRQSYGPRVEAALQQPLLTAGVEALAAFLQRVSKLLRSPWLPVVQAR